MNSIKLWCAGLGTLLLSGCAVGLNIRVGNQQDYAGKSAGPRVGESAGTTSLRTQAEILRQWGPPSRKFVRAGQENWVYRHGLLWWGVDVHLILLPIPLRVPVCQRKERLIFENDSLRSYTSTNVREHFFGYFCGDTKCGGFFGGPMKL